MSDLAKKLNVVLPISFFERDNNAYFNSIAVIDADGAILGKYRKSHIPDGPGYLEKYPSINLAPSSLARSVCCDIPYSLKPYIRPKLIIFAIHLLITLLHFHQSLCRIHFLTY